MRNCFLYILGDTILYQKKNAFIITVWPNFEHNSFFSFYINVPYERVVEFSAAKNQLSIAVLLKGCKPRLEGSSESWKKEKQWCKAWKSPFYSSKEKQ